ncbi:MAG: tRNA-dihydrouridine synthase, partial [Lachnospiraceae bacterium]|nr:tRNA-dihydrouridine synthase [Lachnospiraceae bacterium]
DTFVYALKKSRAPVCYNGDIFTIQDYQMITERFPELNRIMLGRGLLANPGLLLEILTEKTIKKEEWKTFHDRLYHDYSKIMSGDKNTLFKMKELWNYFQFLFGERDRHIKKIRKAKNFGEYEAAVNALFTQCPFIPDGGFRAD